MTGEVVQIHKSTNDGMIEMLQNLIDKVESGEVNSIACAAILTDGGEMYSHDNDHAKRTQMIGTLTRLGILIDKA